MLFAILHCKNIDIASFMNQIRIYQVNLNMQNLFKIAIQSLGGLGSCVSISILLFFQFSISGLSGKCFIKSS